MWRIVLKIFWNVFRLVALVLTLVLIGRWLFNSLNDALNPQAITSSTPKVIARRGVVEAIKEVNKQIFIEHYNIVDVEYTEAPSGWINALGLKQEFIVLVRGRVPAGFDLEQLDEDNIWVSKNGKRIQLTLPSPTIFEENVAIDLENSRLLAGSDSCPDFLCQNDLTAYQTEILPTAKTLLIEYAHENGILNQAAQDGKTYYEHLLISLGFEDVRVIVNGYD